MGYGKSEELPNPGRVGIEKALDPVRSVRRASVLSLETKMQLILAPRLSKGGLHFFVFNATVPPPSFLCSTALIRLFLVSLFSINSFSLSFPPNFSFHVAVISILVNKSRAYLIVLYLWHTKKELQQGTRKGKHACVRT